MRHWLDPAAVRRPCVARFAARVRSVSGSRPYRYGRLARHASVNIRDQLTCSDWSDSPWFRVRNCSPDGFLPGSYRQTTARIRQAATRQHANRRPIHRTAAFPLTRNDCYRCLPFVEPFRTPSAGAARRRTGDMGKIAVCRRLSRPVGQNLGKLSDTIRAWRRTGSTRTR